MSELSRLQKHQRRRKGSKSKQQKRTSEPAVTPSSGKSKRSTSSRPAKKPAASSGMSRSRTRGSEGTRAPSSESSKRSTPSRSRTYSSQRVRMSKWFVNSLIVLFIMLMAGLLWWGLIGAPSLEDMF
ncbi:hypothetical protein [Paenibacillus lemnae]|uniref:Uncharacterized protein n=1 Tax=Paenibacillus lemnae TaxID=1330551 RepID=A0A848MBY1_PAELE|nr:hypothetical protein [Paenibacillus lemnae]NMO96944.1 hypothetical protein [Paenibacillus lemnae]